MKLIVYLQISLLAFVVLCFVAIARADSSTAMIGQRVSILVTAEGTQPFTYQWYKNGTTIAGATNQSLTLAAVSIDDAAIYTATVKNPWGSTVSDEAVLTVQGVPPSNAKTSTTLVLSLSPQPRRTMLSQFLPSPRR